MTVVCFGELLLRLTAPCRELLFQTPRLDVHVGGAEANVAVGLASLGHRTKVISRVPANPMGQAAIDHLRRYGVDTSAVTIAPGRMGLYFLSPGAGLRASEIAYDREGSAFASAVAGDFDWDTLLEGASFFHMSGITAALGPGSAALAMAAADAAVARGVPISFDGNYRAQLWERWDSNPRAILGHIVGRAEILFGNHLDASLLLARKFGGDGEVRRREAAEAVFDAFPNLRLIASTARHVEDADTHRISARVDSRESSGQTAEITVAGIIDRIGGGDAFAAGVLHGVLCDRDLESTARSGLAVTALKHSLPGDASLFAQRDIAAFISGELDVRR